MYVLILTTARALKVFCLWKKITFGLLFIKQIFYSLYLFSWKWFLQNVWLILTKATCLVLFSSRSRWISAQVSDCSLSLAKSCSSSCIRFCFCSCIISKKIRDVFIIWQLSDQDLQVFVVEVTKPNWWRPESDTLKRTLTSAKNS